MTQLSTRQAAEIVGVSVRRIQTLITSEALKATKISGVWLLDEDEVRSFAAKERLPWRPKKTSLVEFSETQ